jgi:O-antigen/teichoic acid export membrane protein
MTITFPPPPPPSPPGPAETGAGRSFGPHARGAWAKVRLALSLVRLKPFETDSELGRSNERYRRIALTTLSSVAVRGVGTLAGLVALPLVLSHLGKEQYGLWSTITTVVAWVAIFDFGIANGLVNCISRAHGREDAEEARQYVSTALAILLAIAGVLAVLVASLGSAVPWSSVLAVRGAVDDSTVAWSVMAALATFVVGLPLSVVPQIYAGYQRSYVTNAFGLVGTLAGFIALVLAIQRGAAMPIIVLAFGIGPIAASLLGLGYAFAKMPWLRFRVSAVSRSAMSALASRSVPLFLFQIGALAVNETQAIILAHRCNLEVVAEYSIVMRVYVLLLGLVQASTSSFVPSFREAQERGETAWVRSAFRNFVFARVLLATGAGGLLVVAGNTLLRVWLRRSDIAFGPEVWAILLVLLVSATWVTAYSDLLSIMDRLWILVALVLANGGVSLALTYLLAPRLQVFGVLLGTAAVTVLVYTWLVPRLSRPLFTRASAS